MRLSKAVLDQAVGSTLGDCQAEVQRKTDRPCAFALRWNLMYGGWADTLLDYPASCRPQAWSAASALVLASAALGLSADVPAGRLRVAPSLAFAAWFPMRVTGLSVAGHTLTVDVDRDWCADGDDDSAGGGGHSRHVNGWFRCRVTKSAVRAGTSPLWTRRPRGGDDDWFVQVR